MTERWTAMGAVLFFMTLGGCAEPHGTRTNPTDVTRPHAQDREARHAETTPLVDTVPPGGGSQETLAEAPMDSHGSLPEQVLDGTDLLSLAEVRQATLPTSPVGVYRAEQGGATVTVSIAGGPDGPWTVTRVYREAGVSPETKRYQVERLGAQLVDASGELTIQGTEEGLLMFEAQSDVDSIPADYWVHYLR